MKTKIKDFSTHVIARTKLWLQASRAYTMPQTVIPYVFATALASKNYESDYFLSFLGLIGVVLAHLSVNLLDDYFDWKKGAVEEYKKLLEKGLQARTHKCFYLEENLASIDDVLNIALSMDAIACVIGLYIATEVGPAVILIALFAGFMGMFYSAPPLRLSYNGLGELAIGIIYGPLLMMGAYITAGGSVDSLIIFSSIIIGIIVANIGHTHAIMDFKSDVKVGKTSLSTFLKSQDNAILAQAIMYGAAYLTLAIGILAGVFPPLCAWVFITLPKAFALVKLMKTQDKEKKFWMGPMENWTTLQKEGSDWFMMRLYLSRNIVTDFVIILGVTYLIG